MTAAAFRDLTGMAFRNLGRHRVKTVITTLAVTISVALYIFMDAWLMGMNLESRRNIVAYEIGAAKVQSRAYFAKKDDLPMYENFGDWEPIAAALAEVGYDSAPRFVFTGTLYSRSGTAPMVFNGVDPNADTKLLRYTAYTEAGRFPRSGKLELAVGSVAADKLDLGLPRRPTVAEFESDLVGAAATEDDAAFVRGLYVPLTDQDKPRKGQFFKVDTAVPDLEPKMALRDDLETAEIDRFWSILAASGRMDVRISTVIDSKAVPETIRREKFEEVLLSALDDEGRAIIRQVYAADPVSGDYVLSAADPALVGKALTSMLAVDFQGAIQHTNQLIDAVVVGVVNSPNPKMNGNIGFLPLDALQDESGMMLEGRITELLVRAADAADAKLPGIKEAPDTIKSKLAAGGFALPADLEVFDWEAYVADYFAASAGDNVSSRVMILLLFILSSIGIANTMLMAILERTKETGMLRALGMTDGQLVFVYALEAGMIGLLGSAIGMILGCLMNIPMVAYGVDYSGISEEMGGDFGYRIVAIFRSTWNPFTIAASGVVATVLSALTAIGPTLRVLKLPVTESLRFE